MEVARRVPTASSHFIDQVLSEGLRLLFAGRESELGECHPVVDAGTMFTLPLTLHAVAFRVLLCGDMHRITRKGNL